MHRPRYAHTLHSDPDRMVCRPLDDLRRAIPPSLRPPSADAASQTASARPPYTSRRTSPIDGRLLSCWPGDGAFRSQRLPRFQRPLLPDNHLRWQGQSRISVDRRRQLACQLREPHGELRLPCPLQSRTLAAICFWTRGRTRTSVAGSASRGARSSRALNSSRSSAAVGFLATSRRHERPDQGSFSTSPVAGPIGQRHRVGRWTTAAACRPDRENTDPAGIRGLLSLGDSQRSGKQQRDDAGEASSRRSHNHSGGCR
jgi:hypothetical protein